MSVLIPAGGSSHLRFALAQAAYQNYTMMCWGALSTTNTVYYRTFASIEYGATGADTVFIETDTDGLTLIFGTPRHTVGIDGTFKLTPLVWYHLAITFNSVATYNSNVCGYVNGKQYLNYHDVDSYILATTGVVVGNMGPTDYSNNTLSGYVQDFRLWNRILSPSEIQDEYRSGVPVNRKRMICWSPFDTSLTADLSGNGHVWTNTSSLATLVGGKLRRPYGVPSRTRRIYV